MVTEMGVSLSCLQANHKILCLCRTITMEGVDRVDQIHFDGCNVPGESQAMATNRLRGQMKTRLQWCIKLEVLVRNGHDRPLLACVRILLDTDHLANVVHPPAADLVDHAARGAALLVRCTGKLMPLWSPVMMNGACVAQILTVTDKIKLTCYMQEEMNDCYWLFHCYLQHQWGT